MERFFPVQPPTHTENDDDFTELFPNHTNIQISGCNLYQIQNGKLEKWEPGQPLPNQYTSTLYKSVNMNLWVVHHQQLPPLDMLIDFEGDILYKQNDYGEQDEYKHIHEFFVPGETIPEIGKFTWMQQHCCWIYQFDELVYHVMVINANP